jgi:23S rRNA-/tRNA-specific pseudouridylate synthase
LPKQQYEVVFEDENFVAVNKPSGLLSIPDREQSSKSLKEMLLEKYGAILGTSSCNLSSYQRLQSGKFSHIQSCL